MSAKTLEINEIYQAKLEKLKLLEAETERKRKLPHLYGHKYFWWSRTFFESTNRYNFLFAANQCGKSSIAIKKCINWATDKTLWPKLWPQNPEPHYFFYFYPSLKLATREFKNKWIPEFLPRDDMKDDATYGWKAEYKEGEIHAIAFNSGVNMYFMSYNMKVADLQASSPHAVFCDEEMPENIWGEVSARLIATKGHFHLVCTATRGEELWRKVSEGETFKESMKLRITMYDCLTFEDGSPGTKTRKEIEDYKAMLPSQREIDIRVYGKHAKADGLVYPTFEPSVHIVPRTETPDDWYYYSGIDIGSGGSNHPAAITIVAVRPDMRFCKVVKTWRGSTHEITTSADILKQYQIMKKGLNMRGEYYDYASKDFGTVAMRSGETIQPAEKSHEIGVSMLNLLFKHRMMVIEEGDCVQTLIEELQTHNHETKKNKAKDDQLDSLRYAISKIAFDTTHISQDTVVPIKKAEKKKNTREQWAIEEDDTMTDHIDEEVEFWNSHLVG